MDADSVSGVANARTHQAGLSGHVLWLDATANIDTLATPAGIEATVAKAEAAHINTLVVDVKPISGHVVYASKIAPRLARWKGNDYDPNFDRLAHVLAAARRHDLRVYASVNVFSEGHKHFGVGPAYGQPDWQSVGYGVSKNEPVLLPSPNAPWEKVSAWVSPHNPKVRAYETRIVCEIAQRYDVDGIVFDRMRYANLTNDFSPYARADFEGFLGHPVDAWPADVYTYDVGRGERRVPGPLYKRWLHFRAATIHGFVRDAAAAVRATRPGMKLASYVGSWYADYYDVGVNWASDDFDAAYAWMTPGYHKTGYASLLDWIMTGCYFPIATRQQAREQGANPQATVESAGALSNRVVNDAAFVYGGLYLLNYQNEPGRFAQAVRACKAVTQGVMLFDLVYLDQYDWWDVLRDVLERPALAPHAVSDLLPQVRAAKNANPAAQTGVLPAVPVSSTP